MKDKEYTIDIKLSLRVKDVEDEIEAQNYIDDFLTGIYEFIYSSDPDDDHYEFDAVQPDWRTFTEWS